MAFRIVPLSFDPFAPFFGFDRAKLAQRNGLIRVVDTRPGFPCRVSLVDASVGETVLLVNYEHHAANSPFRSTYAIYVRQGAVEAHPEPGEVPEMLRSRLLSVRAFDGHGMLIGADVAEGAHAEALFERLLAVNGVDYLHVHFAKPGCYAARVERIT